MATKGKAAPASTDEQFKFLISCIRYSNNGKVDFTEVANECNIVSKGAAAKRYERMMKLHGLYQGANGKDATTSATSPKDNKPAKEPKSPAIGTPTKASKVTKASPKNPTSNKKRKIASLDGTDDNGIQDDNEGFDTPHIKNEHAFVIKPDPGAELDMPMPPPGYAGYHNSDNDDGAMFQDFMYPAAFDGQAAEAQGGYVGFEQGTYAAADADAGAGALGGKESILID